MTQATENDPLHFFAGGGEMAERIRAFDWSKTPLGPPQTWSLALRTTLRIILASRFPHILWWGPSYIQFYNDPYRPVPGAKHPDRVLGQPASVCWSEIWHVIGPLIDRPFQGGPATWDDDIFLEINRHGFMEESHFTIAYSPVPDETVPTGIGGVLATVHEITDKVVGERRVTVLRDLGARVGDAKTADEACAIIARTLSEHDKDIPFALLYLVDSEGIAQLAGAAGVEMGEEISPPTIELASQQQIWPAFDAWTSGELQIVEQLGTRFTRTPAGPWSDPPHTAVVVPIPSTKAHEPAGLMVAGVSSRLRFDQRYRDFFGLVATQVAAAIANARAYEEEKKRAESLAELDRAKTTFFSNVSHEFRTPLTLMLGPVADLLTTQTDLPPAAKEQLEVVNRNGLRLQKLVNTLLDFSRIEAGRVQASYEPTDLAALTVELASNFRSACVKAGLELNVDCRPLSAPVYVDRNMWEKIVLNLLSNAFKFTLDGRIDVEMSESAGRVELLVQDTGVGVPEEELPRLFERFHRVEGSRGRTQEGSGIGLALVRELVKLHGGEVVAQSKFGHGSVFTVSLPFGYAHLPADRINGDTTLASTTLGAAPFVEEASRWLPESPQSDAASPVTLFERKNDGRSLRKSGKRSRVLLADDNADMRDYVYRLLAPHYDVTAVPNGEVALRIALESPPDLVLTDVMMPGLDGFGLLRRLRAEPVTQDIPVIVLTARTGDESRIEGLEASADDYLTKPFSARELLAHVRARLELAALRRVTQDMLRQRDARKDEFLATLAHELRNPLAPIRNGLQVMRLAGNNSAMLDHARKIVERQVEQMVRLVDDLLDVARISQNKLELRKKCTDLESVVSSAVETSRPLIDAAGHHLEVSLPSEPIHINADPVRLAQALSNLLNNAAKYSGTDRRIWLTAARRGDELAIRVRDAGMGIDRDELQNIFGMFVQVDHSIQKSQGGLGVGLTLVQRIVEMHGGSIHAHSDGLGKGSEFVIRLPIIVAPAAAAVQGAGRNANSHVAGRRILVVDDNLDSADSMALMLGLAGHQVATAHDGLEALETARTFQPDVALLDLGMPRLNGYETAQRIRQEAWGRRMVLIALTGWGQDEDRRRSHAAGFDAHLVKPIEPATLQELLRRQFDMEAADSANLKKAM